MRPEFGDVCHWLIVVSYWTPGSAQRHAYLQAWRLGVKALAIYRDGSKTAQALRTDAHQAKSLDADGEGLYSKEQVDALVQAARVTAEPRVAPPPG